MSEQSIERRLMNLERSAWRWRAAFIVAVAGVGVTLTIGAAKKPDEPTELTVTKLRVVDDQGKTVVLLHAAKDGGVAQVFGRDGEGNGMLSADESGSAVVLTDGKRISRMFLSVSSENNGTGIQILDANEKPVWSTGQRK